MACEKRSSRLPDDIVTEILSSLPAKSIGRFRRVSRSWRAELSSASFVEFHRRRANNPGQPKVFFSPTLDYKASDSQDDDEASDAKDDDEASDSEDEECYFYSWHPGGGSVKKLMENHLWSPSPLTKPLHGLVLIRYVCVGGHNLGGGYHVCNPSTGEFLSLPDTRLPLKTIYRHHLPCYTDVAYGFGYSSVMHEYKAVRMFSSGHFPDTTCCEVLVLGVPTWWRPTAQQPPECVVEEHNPAVFLNGYLHFLREDGGIITLSVNNETFDSLSPPPPYPNPDPEDTPVARMTELDGCLCLCHEQTNGDGPYQVWLLRDYEAQQWEQLYTFDRRLWPEAERMQLQTKWITPLTMHSGRSGHRKIMFGTGTCRVFTVDLDGGGGASEVLLIPDEARAGSFCDSESYPAVGLLDESLVPLGRIIEEMEFRSPTAEAWSDVLKWLPVRSVLELSLVCREWHAIAANPRFCQSHVVHANSIKRHPCIKFVIEPSFGIYWDMDGLDNFPFPPNFTAGLFQCSQPCHGLNVGTWNGLDFLCNPAIRYNQRIEHYDETYENNQENNSFAARIALGYDSDIDDHVLVSLAYEKKNMDTRQYKLRCNVRCVHGDQWHRTEPPLRPVADSSPAYADGKIYWVVEQKLGPSFIASCELVAFDTMKREFEVMEGPPCSYDGGRISVVELHGIIHVALLDQDVDALDVWVMDDSGAWSVEYRIELTKFLPEYSSERTMIMAIDPTDGRILLNTGRSLGYYDLKTGELETIYRVIAQSVRDDERSIFCAVVYQQSLFRPFMR